MKELKVIYRGFGAAIDLGRLAEDDRDVLFQYSAEAIDHQLELSPLRLPLRSFAYPDQQTHYAGLHRIPGLLYDSLPDGWGFQLMDRHMKARGLNLATVTILDRLAYLGENTMGALTYAPAMPELTPGAELTLNELATEVWAVQVDESREVLGELARVGGSPGGARPKVAVYFNPAINCMSTQAGQAPGAEPWLIKFPASDDAVDSCALEALYAQIAHRCHLGMMETRFFELADGLTAFGTKRFDRQGADRIHVHSLAGLLHVDFRTPSVSYDDLFKVVRRLTRDHREIKKAIRLCVFNVLMNNRDDHSKNVAFLLNRQNAWQLTPPFDLTYCSGHRGEHFMDISGEGKAPTRAHIVKAAQSGGVNSKDTEDIIDAVLDCATDRVFKALSKDFAIRQETVNVVARSIEANRQRLAG